MMSDFEKARSNLEDRLRKIVGIDSDNFFDYDINLYIQQAACIEEGAAQSGASNDGGAWKYLLEKAVFHFHSELKAWKSRS